MLRAMSKCRGSLRRKTISNGALRQRCLPAIIDWQRVGFSSSTSTYDSPTSPPLEGPPPLDGTSMHYKPWKDIVSELQSHLDELRAERQLSESDPTPYPTDIKLSSWLKRIRQNFKEGSFGKDPQDNERIELLESIGVYIKPYEQKWEAHFAELVQFREKHGMYPYECEIKQLDEEGKRLWDWTRREKMLYRKYKAGDSNTSMTEERIKRLEEIGFSWNIYNDLWMQRYSELVKYHEHHGNSLVPINYPANQRLAKWVSDQRTQKKLKVNGLLSSLSEERLALLRKVDFEWNALEAKWLIRYEALVEHMRVNGRGSYPTRKSNPPLRDWVDHQQRHYRKLLRGDPAPLTDQRKAMLDEIGFPWQSEARSW